MVSGKAIEVPQQGTVLQIKQDDKFFCRLLSKENSMSLPSFRDAAVTVPFVWESQPGTPKYEFSEDALPPLTPPPSYYFNNNNTMKKIGSCSRSNSKKKLLMALFPKLMNLKKAILPSNCSSSPPSFDSSFSSPSNCSSSWSSSDSSSKVVGRRRRFLSHGSSFDFRGDHDEDGDDVTSPNSTLCFGIHCSSSTSNKSNNSNNGDSLCRM
ncbi:uncharacterized protein LOC107485223 [Arachis duranensis]|uniref:Uncharacterized protein LOC107485223 n=1 Tax=Arachis duranensis TaxID=130453 RepID=A0A9C6TWL9_ARADU|nr:uncharacterized protein LOC107485223 [Arachis duranensis]